MPNNRNPVILFFNQSFPSIRKESDFSWETLNTPGISIYGSPLHHAVIHGHVDAVRYLLQHNADKLDVSRHFSGRNDMLPIHISAALGHLEIIEILTEWNDSNEHINARSSLTGHTALMIACEQGHLPIVQYFLQHYPESIDLNARNNDGRTALEIATQQGSAGIISLLEAYESTAPSLLRPSL